MQQLQKKMQKFPPKTVSMQLKIPLEELIKLLKIQTKYEKKRVTLN